MRSAKGRAGSDTESEAMNATANTRPESTKADCRNISITVILDGYILRVVKSVLIRLIGVLSADEDAEIMHVRYFLSGNESIRCALLSVSRSSARSVNEQLHLRREIVVDHIVLYSLAYMRTKRGISMPRAARSVTIRKFTFFVRNRYNLSDRVL